MIETRKQHEQLFHDARAADRFSMTPEGLERRYSNDKWYATVERSDRFLNRWITLHVPGLTVLDFCCGPGGMTLRLAQAGAKVHGIDISPLSIAAARETLKYVGLLDRCHFGVMDAEHLAYGDSTFDAIMCTGALHHLDAPKAFAELSRALKPSGTVIAVEALGYNPIIRAYRKLTPRLRTEWEAAHILTQKDLRCARQYFDEIEVHYFHLFSILATPLRRSRLFGPVLRWLNAIDGIVLKVPGIRLMAWQMIVILRKPNKGAVVESLAPKSVNALG